MARSLVRSLRPLLAVLVAALLGSCGGGGGGDYTPPAPVVCMPIIDSAGGSVACEDPFWGSAPGGGGSDGDAAGADGSAGDGRAIVGATVTLTDSAGHTGTGVTNAQGYYRINVTRFTPPFVLKLVTADGEERHHSLSAQALKLRGFITIDITGLTDKIASDVAVAAGKRGASELTPPIVAASSGAVATARSNLINTIRAQIVAAGLNPDTFDPITLFFRPNLQGYDLVLETTAVFIDNNGATQIVPKPQSACTAPRRWSAGSNACATTNSPGFINSGSTTKLSDSAGPLVGSADFACSNGVVSTVGTPTCAPQPTDQPCAAPTAAWSVGGSTCNADTAPGAINHGQSLTLTDSRTPTTGAITFACNNGQLSQTGTATCATTSAKACSAPAASWTAGALTCQSDSFPSTMTSGTQQILTDATGITAGSIAYGCTDGTLSVQGTPSCALASGSCPAPSAGWTSGNVSCTADTTPQPMSNGQTIQLTDTTGTTTGNVSWRCSDGSLELAANPACQTTQSQACDAPARTWTVAGQNCSADGAPIGIPSGGTLTLTDSVAPAVGSISYSCSNGQLSVSGTPSCSNSGASACSTASLSSNGWSVGNFTCSPDSVPATIGPGVTLIVDDTLEPTVGSITVQCQNGELVVVGTPNCSGPASQRSCSAFVTGWSGGGPTANFTCTPDGSSDQISIPSGSSFSWFDTVPSNTGRYTLACRDGALSVVESICGPGMSASTANDRRRGR